MKTILAKGVAHLSFPGGGVFLPARSPYDLQLLTEHIAHHVRAVGQAQLLVNEQRWLIYVNLDREAVRCSVCGSLSDVACYSPGADDVSCCATCAFSGRVQPQARASANREVSTPPLGPSQVAFDAATVRHGRRPSGHGGEGVVTRGQALESDHPLGMPSALAESGRHCRRRAAAGHQ